MTDYSRWIGVRTGDRCPETHEGRRCELTWPHWGKRHMVSVWGEMLTLQRWDSTYAYRTVLDES